MERIFIADDHPDVLDLLVDGVKHAGYEVISASDGKQAWEKIKKEKPDVVLLDLMMPKMDGYAVLEKLRGEPPFKKWIPVIIISALQDLKDLQKGYSLQADHYITKPWEMRDVLKAIKTMIKLIPQRKED